MMSICPIYPRYLIVVKRAASYSLQWLLNIYCQSKFFC
ncbi:MAG: hypothetical protein OFPI_10130 [Osedax symbiont Rs2]|nr:MAG: hypothetical protein OFPI_10130 [Osedax symbiont Rs2]